MNNSPNPENQPESNANRRIWLLWLSRFGLSFGVILLVGLAAGAWWAWRFVQEELGPLVEKNLAQTLKRPVRLGKVERFSPTGLRFGPSEIPATPTDPDRASVQAVEVAFSPWRLILDRVLQLNVTLVDPNVYIEQEPNGRWVEIPARAEEKAGAIKTEVDSIRIQNANVVLVPQPKPSQPLPPASPKSAVNIAQLNGTALFRDNNQRIRFDLAGQPTTGGNFDIEGEYLVPSQQTNLQVQGQNLFAPDIDRLLKLPLNLQAGRLDANLQVKYNPAEPLYALGTVRTQEVTAALKQAPAPFVNTNGMLLFQGQVIQLQNVSSRFGQIPLQANGGLHILKGYDITATVPSIEITKIAQTLNLKLPVPITGQAKANLRLTGNIQQPILLGQFATTQQTQIDKVNFKTISGQFALSTATSELAVANLQANPVVGGQITGRGQINLAQNQPGQTQQPGGMVFDLQAQNVPGDAIAKLYNTNLSPDIKIGQVNARAQVFGPFNDLRTVARWQAPAATYPANGEVVIARGQTIVRDTTINVAGSPVQVAARVANNRWEALVQGSQLRIGTLVATFREAEGQRGRGAEGQEPLPAVIQQATLTGRVKLSGTTASFKTENIQAIAQGRLQVAGGTIQIPQAALNRGQWEALAVASGVQTARFLSAQQLNNLPIRPGAFNGRARLTGNVNSFQLKDIRAIAQGRLQVDGSSIQIQQAALNQGNWEAVLAASQLPIRQFLSPQQRANLPPRLGGFTGQVKLAGNVDSFQTEDIRAVAQGRLQFTDGGVLAIRQAGLAEGKWAADIQASSVLLSNLPQVPPQFQQARLNGQFRFSGTTESFQLADIRAVGNGNLQVAGGNVQIGIAAPANNRWQAVLEASGLQLARLLPPQQARNLPVQQGTLSGRARLEGSFDSLQPEAIQAVAQGTIRAAGGTIQIQQAQLNEGRWQALFDASGVQLSRISPQLRGQFSAENFRIAGTLDSFQPANIQAAGQVRLSQGVAAINGPLTASIQWNGQQLQIQQATAPGLQANGIIAANFNAAGTPQITAIDLNVAAQDLNLKQLPINLPNNVAIAGQADFTGRITGTPTNPNVVGNLRLENFAVGGLDFEPVLTGSVQSPAAGGVQLDVSGTRDRIALQLGPNNQPESFFIQRNETIAQGRRQGDQLLANVQNLPIATLKAVAPLPPAFANLQVAGILSGDFALNLNDNSITGRNVAIANAQIGTLQGYQVSSGSFRYSNGVVEITGGELQQGESRYAFSGRFVQTSAGPQFQARLQVTQGKIQEVLKAFNTFNVPGLVPGATPPPGRAADVQTVAVGLPNASLEAQLRRLSEIEALLREQVAQRCEASPVPDLQNLQGTFGGEVNVAAAPQAGIALNFDLQAQNLRFAQTSQNPSVQVPQCNGIPLEIDQVVARGSLRDGVLTVSPLQVQLDEGQLAFAGQIQLDRLSGQFTVTNLPIDVVEQFVALPVDLTGRLNGTATLTGTIADPTIVDGLIALEKGTINQIPLQNAQARFNYDNARLNFNSQVLVAETNPVEIAGSIPYQLPFASVAPDSDQINLRMNVQNEGLALLNLVSGNQVEWVDGQGEVRLRVDGTLQQPRARGIARVQNATFRAAVLRGEPLTNVSGTVRFNSDRIRVENVQGQYSNGQVNAQGILPISERLPGLANPLTVNLRNLDVNLKGLYQGGVSGDVVITGAALSPIIGGTVQLANGQVFIAPTNDTAAPATANGTAGNQITSPPEFNNLQLTLGEDVAIAFPPLLRFEAKGDLTVNGPLYDLQPEGTIQVARGSVNLFTTQFTLARGYEQTATFTPAQGLDPILDVRLVAIVPEVTRSRLPSSTVPSEISDVPAIDYGAVRSVRVQAIVNGPASQLANNLELRSEPQRSEAEIVALIGGGFINTLGQADSTLGIANLAGAAFLSPIQGTISRIGTAIGLSELRLFPTVTSERSRSNDSDNTTRLGFAAEAGIDITRNLSASVVKVLTTNQPPEFNLRYRLTDEILLRGAVDLSGEGRAVIEYEKRF